MYTSRAVLLHSMLYSIERWISEVAFSLTWSSPQTQPQVPLIYGNWYTSNGSPLPFYGWRTIIRTCNMLFCWTIGHFKTCCNMLLRCATIWHHHVYSSVECWRSRIHIFEVPCTCWLPIFSILKADNSSNLRSRVIGEVVFPLPLMQQQRMSSALLLLLPQL